MVGSGVSSSRFRNHFRSPTPNHELSGVVMSSPSSREPSVPIGKNRANFTREFLFADAGIVRDHDGVHTAMTMDERLEGWRRIPHGGIAMGAVMELAALLREEWTEKDRGPEYPLTVDFRLGGAGVRIGDKVEFTVLAAPEGIRGTIFTPGNNYPYLSAVIGYGIDDPQRRETFQSYLPATISNPAEGGIPLPYYRNCFVCGVARRQPGLERRFLLGGDDGGTPRLAYAAAGFDVADGNTFYRFQSGGRLSALPALALLDETMGWAGFLSAASGAVTVRIGYTFYRDIRPGERLVFIGRNERVRGRAGARLFFWTSGGAVSLDDAGRCEPVIASSAQYLGVAELTEQMRQELIPPELTSRAFRMAGITC